MCTPLMARSGGGPKVDDSLTKYAVMQETNQARERGYIPAVRANHLGRVHRAGGPGRLIGQQGVPQCTRRVHHPAERHGGPMGRRQVAGATVYTPASCIRLAEEVHHVLRGGGVAHRRSERPGGGGRQLGGSGPSATAKEGHVDASRDLGQQPGGDQAPQGPHPA
eukprot:641843-Pyramimonas_sp.AAC.1